MSTITLKICSGLHRGADIELADGVWVFGRDDSADIILADEGLMRRPCRARRLGGWRPL